MLESFLGFENRGAFDRNHPGLLADCVPMINFMVKVNQRQDESDFEGAIRSLLLYCWELSVSIVKLVETGLPTGGISLARSLWESVMGTMHLIEHPEKIVDFIDHAEYVSTRIIVSTFGKEPEAVNKFGMVHGTDSMARYHELRSRFGQRGWHRLSVDKLAEVTGFERLYSSFYREASTIAHGGSLHLLVPRSGIGTSHPFAKDETSGRDYATMGLKYAMVLIGIVSRSANGKLGYGYDGELTAFEANLVRRQWMPASELSGPSPV